MNPVKSTWRQLVRRRLWPVAVLLVAALAAIPVVLAHEPEAPTAPLVPAEAVAANADDAIAEPIVAEVTPEDRARRRRVLGVRKDPFKPAPVRKAKADEPSEPTAPTQPDTGKGTGGTPVGGGLPTTPSVPVQPLEPAAPKRYFSPGTIVVRFGDAKGETLEKFAVRKLSALPDDELPLLIYMGLTKDGKRAKFLVDAAVEVDGDGRCRPHRSSCEMIELAVGETEFLDVIEQEPDADEAEDAEDEDAEPEVLAQYQLDLVDIKRAGDDDVK